MNRKKFIYQSSLVGAGLLLNKSLFANWATEFPIVRVPLLQRKFTSPAVEAAIAAVKKNIGNKEIAWLFENCFPNTLDTTVEFEIINGKPDTFVITGDIDAMWLRDSSAQVWPYLPLMKEDPNLRQLIEGVIRRQTKCILKDPYANAFYKDENKISEWKDDHTLMKPGVHERKWEIDSLCYPIRLAHAYWKETGDTTVFDEDWKAAMQLVLQTFKEQQRLKDNGPYRFQRTTSNPVDSVPLNGYGYPTKKIGLIHAMFRPSDDATVFPFNIPGNLFAARCLQYLGEIFKAIHYTAETNVVAFASHIEKLVLQHAVVKDPSFGNILAYEINGMGSHLLMDDANIPSLLSLAYLGIDASSIVYQNTRKFSLSNQNPFYFSGKAATGIGGPHIGMDYIWPMGLIMRGLTSKDEKEMAYCLKTLQSTHAGTGFMHEGFHKDDAGNFTRKWFAWANTLFGEFILKLYREKKQLLH